MHIRIIRKTNETVTTGDASRGIVHDLRSLGRREDGREEGL